MANRNHVTADLRVSANAELKNSREFISKLDRIIDGFDFGDKMNNQLISAQEQLKNLNKILEKVQNKSVISDNELKELVKAGKEISDIVNKTEKLYSGFNSSDWKRYSKEYIAQVEAQQKEIAKIKEKYNKETGGNFDKDFANLDKYNQKLLDLSKNIEKLNNSKDEKIQNRIDEENKALQEQFEILEKVKRVEEERKTKRQNAINTYNENNIPVSSSNGKVKLSKEDTRRDMANNEYQKMVSTFTEVSRKRQEILDSGKSEEQIQKELVALAKQYGIQNVKNTEQFNKQLRILQEQKNFYKLLKNRDQLVTEKAVTEEYEKRVRLAQELDNIDRKIYSDNGFNSEKDLKVQRRKAESALNSSRVEITGTGANLTKQAEDDISNEIVSATTEQTNKLGQEMANTRSIIEQISQYAAKLATQSERDTDEQDIKKIESSVASNLEKNKKNINDHTKEDNSRIAAQITQEFNREKIEKYKTNIDKGLDNLTNEQFGDNDIIDANKKLVENSIEKLFYQLEDAINGKNNFEELSNNINEIIKLTDELENAFREELSTRQDISAKNIEVYKSQLKQPGNSKAVKGYIEDSIIKEENTIKKDEKILGSAMSSAIKIGDIFTNVLSILGTQNGIGTFSKSIADSVGNLQKAAEQSQFLGSAFDDLKGKIGYFLSLNYLFDQITRKISEAAATTRELDKDMTQIGLVLGKTSGQIWKNFDTYSKMADRLNTTTSEVTNSMKLFYQQGLNTAEVNKMVEASAIAAALGESSMAEASETLTSIINSYNLSANEAMMVTSKISQIAIVSAADFGELSTAIEKVASSAASAGLDLDHMMGYLAKMIETTREAPTNIGTALKTIVANFTQFKEDPTGLTQEGTEINKVDTALKSVGISLTDTTGEVRDLSDVLDELGGKWENLTRSQKSYLATQIAGTRQQSRFYALMNDYERTLELVAEGSNSSGKAQQQFALYGESLEASTKRLNNEWEKFFNQITSGNGVMKGFNSLLAGLMSIVNEIGPIGTVLGLGNFIRLIRKGMASMKEFSADTEKLLDNEKGITSKLKELTKPSCKLRNTDGSKIKDTNGKTVKNQNYKKQKEKYKKDIFDLAKDNGIAKSNIKIAQYQQKINEVNDKLKSMKLSKKKLKLSGEKLWDSMKMKTLQAGQAIKVYTKQLIVAGIEMLAMYAIGKVFEGITKAIDAASESAEKLAEKSETATENANTIKALRDEYEKLANTVNRTEEENERMKEITKEITEVSKELGDTLKNNIDAFNDNIKSMDAYIERQNKIAGASKIEAAKKQSKKQGNKWNSFWREQGEKAGGEKAKKTGIEEAQAYYLEISEGTTQQNNFSNDQKKIFNDYVNQWMKEKEQTWKNSTEWYNGIEEFESSVKDFASKISNMTPSQQKEYTGLVTDTANQDLSYNDLMKKVVSSSLSNDEKKIFINDINSGTENAKQVIKDKTNLSDADINSFVNQLPRDILKQIFDPTNLDILDEKDKAAYWSSITKIFEDTKLREALIKSVTKNGENGLIDFLNNVTKAQVPYNDIIIDVTSGLKTLADTVENAKNSFEKLESIVSDNAWTGKNSQLDIIESLINDKYNIKDVRNIGTGNNSLLTLNFDSLIAQWDAAFTGIEEPFRTQQQKLQDTINYYSNYGSSLVENAKKELEDKKIKVSSAKTELETARTENTNAHNNVNNAENEIIENDRWQDMAEVVTRGFNPFAEGKDLFQRIMSVVAGPISTIGEVVKYNIEASGRKNNLEQAQEQERNSSQRLDSANKNYIEQLELQNQAEENLKKANFQKELLESHEERLTVLARQRLQESGEEQNTENIAKTVDELKEEKKALEESANAGKEMAEDTKEGFDTTLNAIEQIKNKTLNLVKTYKAVFETFAQAGQIDSELNGIAQAYDLVNAGAEGYFDVSQAIANDPSLIDALDMESEYLEFNKKKLEKVAAAKVEAQITDLKSRLEGTKAIIGLIQEEINARNGSVQQEAINLEDKSKIISSAMSYNDDLTENQKNSTETEKENLGISINNWQEWEKAVIDAIQKVENVRAQLASNAANNSTEATQFDKSLAGYSLQGGKDKISSTEPAKAVVNKYAEDVNKLKGKIHGSSNSKLKDMLSSYQKQKTILEKSIASLQNYKKNIGANLAKRGGGSSGGGSKDEFEPLIEKLDHFYNYLRKIEKLEAKINRLREERNLIDTSKNYYIDNLIEENELLAEQQELYSNYIKDQGEYLTELREQLTKNFSKWVTFDSEGVVQVKQTEFNLNSEKQQEEYENFSELLGLYQDEYNTREENITKLTQAQIQQVENIAAAYEKVLARVTDVNDAIQKSIDLLEHDVTMSFSNIAKFDIFDEQAEKAVKGIREMFGFVNEYQAQIDKINKQVSEGALKEFFRWDEDLGYYRSNDLLLEDKDMQKKYEKMGYSWSEIHTYVKQTAKASEQLKQSWEESTDKANSFAETLKSLLENSISTFTNLVSSSGDELNKIFDTFDRKMNNIDNESNLFGVASENLEDKYVTLVTATATLKQTIGLLNDKRVAILDTIKEQYSEFVDEINGYTVINKQAIEESDKLTDGQKAQLLSWYEAFNAYDELVEASEDRLVDYFNQILEMENEKRDAIINLKQSVHDELIARDQEEIDDLKEKYDKMSQLDNEYYNKLADKVNRARQLREDRQADSAIPQTQAQIAVLKTDNSGTRNSEILNLQKQLNEQLQSQADRDVDRELERIQREQQEREEDRQLTIAAMENVLTFKDENNWYWQEAQRIWAEGPESVTGFLRTSNEYMNISDEQRAQLFEELSNSVNTAFATLQTAAGITSAISDGIVKDKSDEEQAKLDNVNNNLGFIQSQLGQEGLAGKIDWANAENAKHLLEIQTNADGNALKITTKLEDLYKEKIGPTAENLQNTVVQYLGKESDIWRKLGMLDATTGQVNTSVESGFTQLTDAVNKAITWISSDMDKAWSKYKTKAIEVFNYLSKEYGKQNAQTPDKNDVKLPDVKKEPTKNEPPKPTTPVKTDNSSGGTSKKTLKVGGGATAKTGAKIYSSYSGGSGAGQYYSKDPNYKVLQLRGNRALVRWHKLSSGYTGWFNKTDLTPYRKGGYVNYTGIAAVHGSKTSPEAFLSAKQTKLFEVLRDSLVATTNKGYTKEEKEVTNTGYNIDNINIEVKELADVDSVEKMTRKVKEEIYKDATGRNNMAVRRR